MNSVRLNSLSLKYQRFPISSYKDIGIRNLSVWQNLYSFIVQTEIIIINPWHSEEKKQEAKHKIVECKVSQKMKVANELNVVFIFWIYFWHSVDNMFDYWNNNHKIILIMAFPKCGLPFFALSILPEIYTEFCSDFDNFDFIQ